jgi:hypothetical protein
MQDDAAADLSLQEWNSNSRRPRRRRGRVECPPELAGRRGCPARLGDPHRAGSWRSDYLLLAQYLSLGRWDFVKRVGCRLLPAGFARPLRRASQAQRRAEITPARRRELRNILGRYGCAAARSCRGPYGCARAQCLGEHRQCRPPAQNAIRSCRSSRRFSKSASFFGRPPLQLVAWEGNCKGLIGMSEKSRVS